MREILIAGAALATLLGTPVLAADMPVKAPPPAPPPVWSWSGIYIGGEGGYSWGYSEGSEYAFLTPLPGAGVTGIFPPVPFYNTKSHGAFGGGTIGANYQFNQAVVVGVEADWSAADIDGTNQCNAFGVAAFGVGFSANCQTKLTDFGTFTARLGWLFFNNQALIYAKGGGALGHFDYQTTSASAAGVPGPAASFSVTEWGYDFGTGIEWHITGGWMAKVEYDYLGFDRALAFPFVNVPPFVPGIFTAFSNEHERVNLIRLGVNYKFDWAGPGPVVAKY